MTKIKLNKVSIELLAPNIVLVTPNDNCTLEIEDIKKIKETNIQLTKGEKYGVISYTGNNSIVSADARNYLSTKAIEKNKLAAAYVITQLPQRILLNFFIRFNKPSVPTKSFSEKQAALKWVKKLLANS